MQSFNELTESYLEKGISIIPVVGKKPFTPNWQKYSLELPDNPLTAPNQTGIGICLGPASNLVAVDIDTDDKNVLDKVPYSPVVRRGRKGEVRFFQYNKNIDSRTYHKKKIEILSVGRQVVIPPSIHPETNKPYEWTQGDLLNFDISLLPELDLSFIESIPDIGFELKDGAVGRNNKLKDIASACLTRYESIEDTANEVYEYDKEMHTNRLFIDKSEGFSADTEAKAFANASSFVASIYRSLISSGVLTPLSKFSSIEDQQKIVAPSQFEKKSYPEPEGMLKKIKEYIQECSYTKVPNMAIGSAIAILATVIGNMFRYSDVFPNQYVLLIAKSGTGKKFGISAAKSLLDGKIGSADYLSSPAIYSGLEDHIVRLDVSEEFSKVLKLIKDGGAWQSAIPQDLCALWSASYDDFYLPASKGTEKDKKNKISRPNISILASTTESEFKESVNKSIFTSGLIPRFLIFMDERSKEVKIELDREKIMFLEEDIKRDIGQFVARRNKYTGAVAEVEYKLSDASRELFYKTMQDMYDQAGEAEDDAIRSILNRSREHLKKLMLLHAVSRLDASLNINEDDIVWARDVIETSIHNAKAFISEASAENQMQSHKERVFNIIASSGKISKSDLVRKTQFLASRQRDDLLKDLIDAGRIGYCEESSAKKPRKVFFAT